jgi:hypothetical protein
MQDHTRGPWSIDADCFETAIAILEPPGDSSRLTIAEVWPIDPDGDIRRDKQALANARLIAAAPEMQEALEEMIAAYGTMLTWMWNTMPDADRKSREATLRKAQAALFKSGYRLTGQEDGGKVVTHVA